jgi:hypothetical protein
MNRRSQGIKLRKEDSGIKIKIDGTVYYITDEFMEMGNKYYDETGVEWTAFAFNKMPDGSNIIRGNTDEAGIFGADKYDFDDTYDVYVLGDYMRLTKQDLVDRAFSDLYLNDADIFIQDILKKYISEIFESHMSDYAKFWTNHLIGSDIDQSMVILYNEGTEYGELENVKDEFEEEFTDARMFLYPDIEGWTENLEKDLIEAYENEGWVQSKVFEPDWISGVAPGGTRGLCFVIFEDDEDDEDDEI